jgi:hypothetical protein
VRKKVRDHFIAGVMFDLGIVVGNHVIK